MKLTIKTIDKDFAIVKLSTQNQIPDWVNLTDEFISVTKTGEELSVVMEQKNIPSDIQTNFGWKIFKIEGILDFSLIGVISSISEILAKNNISIFVISTFNTDYFLVKEENFDSAKKALSEFYNLI